MSNTPEQIAVQACKESARDNGIVGGSAYDCALRAATIALQSAADTPAPQTHVNGRWRAFEAATGPGYWGIELEDAGNDDDAIMYPIKIHRDTVARIVDAHNAALAATATEALSPFKAKEE